MGHCLFLYFGFHRASGKEHKRQARGLRMAEVTVSEADERVYTALLSRLFMRHERSTVQSHNRRMDRWTNA
jgi:hypothetical protein